MSHPNNQSNKDNLPKWAAKITLAQLTLAAFFLSAIGLSSLIAELSDERPSLPKMILPLILLGIALRLWLIWFRLKKTRTSWYTDE